MPVSIPPARTIRVALLVCAKFPKRIVAKHGDYHSMFRRWLKDTLPPRSGVTLSLEGYDVMEGNYPRDDELHKYDAVMITGSPAYAGSNVPWITRLVDYVRHVETNHSQVRLYGICLGHQIVSRALGGRVEQNEKGWEIGSGIVHATNVGRLLFGVNKLEMEHIHRDYVPLASLSSSLTSGDLQVLGCSSKCLNQGLVKFYPLSPDSDLRRSNLMEHVHILTVQGHPEFTPSIVSSLTGEMLADGVVDSATLEGSRKHNEVARIAAFNGVTQVPNGSKILGNVFWKTLGVHSDL